MVLSETTVDMKDRVEELESRIEDLEEEKQDLIELAEQQKEDGEEVDEDLEADWDELQEEIKQLKGEKQKFEESIEEWGGSKFTLEELAFGQVRRINDDMVEESFEVDVEEESIEGVPASGFYQMEMIREAVKETPPGAPTRSVQRARGTIEKPEPGSYPNVIGEWLYDKIDTLNSTGDVELGNSLSLEEAMNSTDSEQNSSTEESNPTISQ